MIAHRFNDTEVMLLYLCKPTEHNASVLSSMLGTPTRTIKAAWDHMDAKDRSDDPLGFTRQVRRFEKRLPKMRGKVKDIELSEKAKRGPLTMDFTYRPPASR